MKQSDPELEADLKAAVDCIKKGGIILYPTDTIWGIGCDARNSDAVKRIYDLKKREDSKSMLVLANNEVALEKIVDNIPDITWELLEYTLHISLRLFFINISSDTGL